VYCVVLSYYKSVGVGHYISNFFTFEIKTESEQSVKVNVHFTLLLTAFFQMSAFQITELRKAKGRRLWLIIND